MVPLPCNDEQIIPMSEFICAKRVRGPLWNLGGGGTELKGSGTPDQIKCAPQNI